MRLEFEKNMNRSALYDENDKLVGESTFYHLIKNG